MRCYFFSPDGVVGAGWVALRDDAPSQDFEMRSLSDTVGAEVLGLDLSHPINPTDFASIHRAQQGMPWARWLRCYLITN